MRFKAFVQTDFLRDSVRLQVAQDRGNDRLDVLIEDGTWQSLEIGALLPDTAGLPLPAGSLEAVAEAIGVHLGNRLPSQAEVSVLREWLKVEQGRVDSLLERRI